MLFRSRNLVICGGSETMEAVFRGLEVPRGRTTIPGVSGGRVLFDTRWIWTLGPRIASEIASGHSVYLSGAKSADDLEIFWRSPLRRPISTRIRTVTAGWIVDCDGGLFTCPLIPFWCESDG